MLWRDKDDDRLTVLMDKPRNEERHPPVKLYTDLKYMDLRS
jgi:hypothetical protein